MTGLQSRRLLRPFWVFLAVLFLVEAWLWDHLSVVVGRLVSFIPLDGLKWWLAQAIGQLSPWATLIVFIIPFLLLEPLKLLEVYFLAKGDWLGAIGVILAIKLVGLGVTAFLFDLTRDKLLQMPWFRALYEWVLRVRAWAHDLTEPVRLRVKEIAARFRSERGGFVRWLKRLRRYASRRAA